MLEKDYSEYLDSFEKRLEAGLVKICGSTGVLSGELLSSPDIDGKWDDYIKDYVADAVGNFVQYPDAALSWAAYLGMGVASHWDRDWDLFRNDPYCSYYGPRGWDDMDEHVSGTILKLSEEEDKHISDTLKSCSMAVTAFIRHEGIEAQTALGFYALTRAYGVMFRIGEAIELRRLGYKLVKQNESQ